MVLRGKMYAKSMYSYENNTSNIHGNFHLNTLTHSPGTSIYIVHIHNFIGAQILFFNFIIFYVFVHIILIIFPYIQEF